MSLTVAGFMVACTALCYQVPSQAQSRFEFHNLSYVSGINLLILPLWRCFVLMTSFNSSVKEHLRKVCFLFVGESVFPGFLKRSKTETVLLLRRAQKRLPLFGTRITVNLACYFAS